MLVRVVRAVCGAGLLVVGLPLLLAGGALWFALQHQSPAGGYEAPLATVSTDGYAVVASDVDGLLRREAPFARSGQTTVRLTAQAGGGPAFVGLAPATDAARYLAGVPYDRIDEVRLARGPLPVATSPVTGDAAPAGAPQEQPFWLNSGTGSLEWTPHELRGQQVTLVVMGPAAEAPLSVDLTARVHPQWLTSTTVGLLVLGTVLVLVAIVVLAWPGRSREIVYVVPPAELPEIAARLGVRVSQDMLAPTEPLPPMAPTAAAAPTRTADPAVDPAAPAPAPAPAPAAGSAAAGSAPVPPPAPRSEPPSSPATPTSATVPPPDWPPVPQPTGPAT